MVELTTALRTYLPLEPDGFTRRLVAAALERTEHRVEYDGSYRRIPYPGGDVPDRIGVCTDLVIRMEVPRQEVARAASVILSRYPVADLSIEDVEIGTVIENILHDRGDEQQAGTS